MKLQCSAVLLTLLCIGLFLTLPAQAAEDRVKLVYPLTQKEPSIPIKWETDSFKTVEAQAELRGVFLKSEWGLLLKSGEQSTTEVLIRSTKKDEAFVINVPLQGQITPITLIAVEPSGVAQKDEFNLVYDNWNFESSLPSCHKTFCLKSFQMGPIFISNSTGILATAKVSWTPYYQKPQFLIQANLGAIPVWGLGNLWYVVLEYGLSGSAKISGPFWIDALIGFQYWTDYSIHSPVVGSNLAYRFNRKILFWVDRVTLGYSAFFPPANFTHEVNLGIGLSF